MGAFVFYLQKLDVEKQVKPRITKRKGKLKKQKSVSEKAETQRHPKTQSRFSEIHKTDNPVATLLFGFLLHRVLFSCVLARLVVSDQCNSDPAATLLGAPARTPPRAAGGVATGQL